METLVYWICALVWSPDQFVHVAIAAPLLLLGGIITVSLASKLVVRLLGVLMILLFPLGLASVFFGSSIAAPLVARYGEAGTGVVVSSGPTSTIMNHRQVYHFAVLLRSASGQTMETGFDSDFFNLYPAPANGEFRYPGRGERFAVKYLKGHPDTFVILTNAPSPYADARQCEALQDRLDAAQRAYDFAPTQRRYRLELANAIKARYLQGPCRVHGAAAQAYEQRIHALQH